MKIRPEDVIERYWNVMFENVCIGSFDTIEEANQYAKKFEKAIGDKHNKCYIRPNEAFFDGDGTVSLEECKKQDKGNEQLVCHVCSNPVVEQPDGYWCDKCQKTHSFFLTGMANAKSFKYIRGACD